MKIISLDFETYVMSIETGPTPKPVVLARSVNGAPATLHIGDDMEDRIQYHKSLLSLLEHPQARISSASLRRRWRL